MNQGKKEIGINVGLTTLIMIFAVLCIVVFSVLTYKTALYEKKLAVKTANATKEYYAADYKANEVMEQLKSRLDKGKGIDSLVSYNNSGKIKYSVKINDNSNLNVELKNNGKKLKIIRWEITTTKTEKFDDTLKLWDGK